MTKSSSEAGGAAPSGADTAVFRPAKEMIAGFSAAGMMVLAVGLIGRTQVPVEVAGPVRVAAGAVRPLLPPEGLAGPAAALAPDSRALIQALLKKAGLRPTLDPHRLSWDQARRVNALLPPDRSTPDVAQPFRLDVTSKNGRQALTCLTQAAYYEAGANGRPAQAAVVQVVLNRVRHPDFPKSVCGVVYEGSGRASGCQFTFTCDGAMRRPVEAAAWDEARKVARRALDGYVDRAVGTATYYHADYVFPTWAPTLVKMATVGPHIFYRMTGPEGAVAYLTGRYAGDELKLVRAALRGTDRRAQKKASDAETQPAAMPAALRAEAGRLQRVKAEIAAATPKADDKPVVETASIQESIQSTLKAAAPPPAEAPAAAAPAATVEAAPAA